MSDSSEEVYDRIYQQIVTLKVLFGSKILRYRDFETKYVLNNIEQSSEKGLILDLGCCTGYITRKLAERFGTEKVHGADINKKSINKLQTNKKIKFFHINKKFYASHKYKYDFILLSHVLEHIPEPHTFIENINRLLNEEGKIIICVPQERIRGDSSLIENLYNFLHFKFENVHRINYDYEKLARLLDNCGLSICSHKYNNAFREKMNKKSFFNHSMIVVAERDVSTTN